VTGAQTAPSGTSPLGRLWQMITPKRTGSSRPESPKQLSDQPAHSTLVPTPQTDLTLPVHDNASVSGSSELTFDAPIITRTSADTLSQRNVDIASFPATSGLALRTSPSHRVGSGDSDNEISFSLPRQMPPVFAASRPEGPSRKSSRASSHHSANLADRMYDDLADILRRQSAEKENVNALKWRLNGPN